MTSGSAFRNLILLMGRISFCHTITKIKITWRHRPCCLFRRSLILLKFEPSDPHLEHLQADTVRPFEELLGGRNICMYCKVSQKVWRFTT